MIAATATFAALANSASAQAVPTCPPETGSACTNDQTQNGRIIAEVNLDVAVGQLNVSNGAGGNVLMGGIRDTAGALISRQTLTAPVTAQTNANLNGVTDGFVNSATQATGNYTQVYTEKATFDVNSTQTATGDNVSARTNLHGPTTHILKGGEVTSAANANSALIGGPSAVLTGTVNQQSQTTVFAETVADLQYIPAPMAFGSQAAANAVQTNTTGASHQDIAVNQVNNPSTVEARTDIYVDNGWNLAARAQANANRAALYNAGGSMLARTNQTNEGRVIADARAQTNLQGQTAVHARAVANEVIAGNNDIYLKLDNTQINSGGVEATATYVGVKGYDSYVSSDAIGNSVTGYACSNCGGEINFNNNQVNNGAVTATTNVNIAQPNRNVAVGANAIGNSATFFISGSGN